MYLTGHVLNEGEDFNLPLRADFVYAFIESS